MSRLRPGPSSPADQPAGEHAEATVAAPVPVPGDHVGGDADGEPSAVEEALASGRSVIEGFAVEDAEDALEEGDRAVKPGTIRSALSHRSFRIVYTGSVLSNIGSWMQNVVMAAFAYDLTRSASFVGLVGFATLGPQLLLSLVGGALADQFDRRKVIIVMAIEQLIFASVLALIASHTDPSRGGLLLAVFMVGAGNALQAPSFASLIPNLVPRRDLSGAVSLNSANMNLSRVIGPAIGGVLYAKVGASWVFFLNALTYLFIVAAISRVRTPPMAPGRPDEPSGLRRVVSGFGVAKRDRVISRSILTMMLFSFFSLMFITQMPVLADENFGIAAKSGAYGVLYATFGLGALAGALSIGTVFANRPLEKVARVAFAGFAVLLLAYGLVRTPTLAYPVGFVLGFFYFAAVTAVSTVLQHRLDDRVRGRVMAVWMMAFGGTVPIGGLVAGWIVEATNVTVICVSGAVVAAFLVWFADLRAPADQPEMVLD